MKYLQYLNYATLINLNSDHSNPLSEVFSISSPKFILLIFYIPFHNTKILLKFTSDLSMIC